MVRGVSVWGWGEFEVDVCGLGSAMASSWLGVLQLCLGFWSRSQDGALARIVLSPAGAEF